MRFVIVYKLGWELQYCSHILYDIQNTAHNEIFDNVFKFKIPNIQDQPAKYWTPAGISLNLLSLRHIVHPVSISTQG